MYSFLITSLPFPSLLPSHPLHLEKLTFILPCLGTFTNLSQPLSQAHARLQNGNNFVIYTHLPPHPRADLKECDGDGGGRISQLGSYGTPFYATLFSDITAQPQTTRATRRSPCLSRSTFFLTAWCGGEDVWV
jgi:hypothetical protein